MTLVLDTVTIRQASLEDKFRLARAAGYDGLELWGDELDEVPHGTSQVQLYAQQHGMPIVGICPHRALYPWHHVWNEAIEAGFSTQIERYAAVGATYLVLPVLSEEGSLAETAANLARVDKIARRFDMISALEPIGHIRKLARFRDAFEILEAVPEACLIADVFHFFRGGNALSELARFDAGRIAAVHLNDAMDLPLEELLGYRHRVYPGRGIFDVAGFCAAVRKQGYAGRYVVELLNPSYWEADPEVVSRTAHRASMEVLEAAERLSQ